MKIKDLIAKLRGKKEIKAEESKEETKRLQEICDSDLQEIKNLEDLVQQKSKLFIENYGKFVQLKLSIK